MNNLSYELYLEAKQEIVVARMELASTRKELDRWKTMVQRHNQSCCCQIDENNGDPKMIKPCLFHAEWRDTALESMREKYYDLIMCVGKKFPDETRHETAKRCIVEREQSSNCSVAVDRLQG